MFVSIAIPIRIALHDFTIFSRNPGVLKNKKDIGDFFFLFVHILSPKFTLCSDSTLGLEWKNNNNIIAGGRKKAIEGGFTLNCCGCLLVSVCV